MTTEVRINTNGGHSVNVIVQDKVRGKFPDKVSDDDARYLVEAGVSSYITHVHSGNRIIIEEVSADNVAPEPEVKPEQEDKKPVVTDKTIGKDK